MRQPDDSQLISVDQLQRIYADAEVDAQDADATVRALVERGKRPDDVDLGAMAALAFLCDERLRNAA
jgi:hypothetical protein